MARKAEQIIADRAPGWSAFTLGAIPKRVRANTIPALHQYLGT
jgi:hypothetical protein